VLGKYLHRNRYYIKLKSPLNGRKTIPYAHYVWLIHNPLFQNIPRGYVLHHLDHDETNDDISNLALMYKSHHNAYHWKQKKGETSPPFLSTTRLLNNEYIPIKKPTVRKKKKTGRFFLDFTEEMGGVKIRRTKSLYRGKRLLTREDAERAANEIWQLSKN